MPAQKGREQGCFTEEGAPSSTVQAEGQTPVQLSPGLGQMGDSPDTEPAGCDSSHIYRPELPWNSWLQIWAEMITSYTRQFRSTQFYHTEKAYQQDEGRLPAPLIILVGLLPRLSDCLPTGRS